MFFQKSMPEERNTLDEEYLKKKKIEGVRMDKEKEIRMMGRTC